MEYVRRVDFAAIETSGADERITQILFDHASGAKTCSINCIKTPAGGGSPAGMHIHAVDQIFYILSGTMNIEIEGKQYDCFPARLSSFLPVYGTATGTAVASRSFIWLSTPPCLIRTSPSPHRSDLANPGPKETISSQIKYKTHGWFIKSKPSTPPAVTD